MKHEFPENNGDIWRLFQSGDTEAFYQLYEQHHPGMFTFGMRMLGNEDLVRDAIHDVFVELWEKRDKVKDIRQLKPYLLKFMRNKLVDDLKKNHRGSTTISISENGFEQLTFSHEDFLIENENSLQLNQQLALALNQLTPKQREIIFLRFYNELSYEEIGGLLDLKYQSVRNLFSEALKKLRSEFLLAVLGWVIVILFR